MKVYKQMKFKKKIKEKLLKQHKNNYKNYLIF